VEPELTVRRRRIGPEELALIRQLIAQEGEHGRTHLSNRLCELWDWRQANGRFRQIACREVLRRLQAKGLVQLPPILAGGRRAGDRKAVSRPEGLDQGPLSGPLPRVQDQLALQRVQGREQSRLFQGLIGTYHYLGYQQPTGAQLKYLGYHQDRPIGCLSFGPAAWQVGARDRFIGWSSAQRVERLEWLVNNDRFLILPWVQLPQLASWLLSQCLRRLRSDWQQVYQHDLALAETFIEQDRFGGRSYAAANWICVGQTQGRGRNDRLFQGGLPIKTIWLYPLRRDFRPLLCAPEP